MIKRTLKTDQLETYLERAGWENEDLTEAASIAPLSLSNWLSKSHGPTPRMIDRITSAINDRYIQSGILITVTREDLLDEILPECKYKIRGSRYKATSGECESNEEFIARFWSKVDRGDPDKCWYWMGCRASGYGQVWDGKRSIGAHRLSWQITHGAIPDGLSCLHKCDHPPCVNPDHLYIGTQKDNVRDMVERSRPRSEPESWAYKSLPL